MASGGALNPRSKKALALLAEHGPGRATVEQTELDGVGPSKQLFVNLTTAEALERRGLVTITDDPEGAIVALSKGGALEAGLPVD